MKILKEAVLNEDIESMKKFYPNIPDEQFMDYIKLDPTYNGGNNPGTYARWILGLANKNKLDNIGHVRDILTRFEENKKQLKEKDIMRFKSIDDLEEYLNDDGSYKDLSHRQEVRQRQQGRKNADLTKDADLVFEDSQWEVWVPKTYEASCKLGQGTSWCTASTESDYYYNYYKDNYGGNYYININKQDPEEKYQFHFETGQFMDADDRSVLVSNILKTDDKLKEFYKEKVVPKFLAEKFGITEGQFKINIDKDDIAEAVSAQSQRDGLSSEFVLDVLNGNAYEDFIQDYDYYSDTQIVYVADEITDDNMKYMQEVFESRNGTDNRDQYENEDVEQKLDYFVTEDSDIGSAVRWAWNDGNEVGAAEEAEKDVVEGIKDLLPDFVVDSDLFNDGASSSVFVCSADELKDKYFDMIDELDENSESVEEMILYSIRNGSIYEPQYGWYGFDKSAFNDRLYDDLYELKQE